MNTTKGSKTKHAHDEHADASQETRRILHRNNGYTKDAPDEPVIMKSGSNAIQALDEPVKNAS